MTYWVSYAISARYTVPVEAENVEEALKKAEYEWVDADFGQAEDVEGKPIIVEDENGNYVYER